MATVRKYNPGFLSDEEVVASFCVRTLEFEHIVETLSENAGGGSSHMIVIGPRGSGKTHLLRRAAVEMRREERIAGYFPIEFAEESYEVSTVGEFWLEGLGRLAEQAPPEDRAGLRLAYDELRAVRDDDALAMRCLGMLLNFSDRRGKRLVLIVENLNMLLPDMTDPDAGWKLRQTLQTEPRVTLLASATSRFAEIDHPEHALYDIFSPVQLRPLNLDDCVALWETASGRAGDRGLIRALQILTGGSPRMIAVVAGFRETESFRELMDNLLELIDDHTEYFKSHIDALPAQERRVYLALARLWKPAETREIADQARMDTSRCSAFLRRLVARGSVAVEGGTARRLRYYLTERLYNIYYLLRRPSGEGRIVDALIEFMAAFYSPERMVDLGVGIAEEYGAGDARMKRLHSLAFDAMLNLPENKEVQVALLANPTVLHSSIADENQSVAWLTALVHLQIAAALVSGGRIEEAIGKCDEIMARFNKSVLASSIELVGLAQIMKAKILLESNNIGDSISIFEEINNRYNYHKHPIVIVLSDLVQIDKIAKNPNAIDDIAKRHIEFQRNFKPEQIVQDSLNSQFAESHIGLSHMILSTVMQIKGDFEGAINQIDMALEAIANHESAKIRNFGTPLLIVKGDLLARSDHALSEGEASTLLKHIAETDEMPDDGLDVIIRFCAAHRPERVLEMLQAYPASDALLPLLVAARQELGEQPRVAHEVAEVARDIRGRLAELGPERWGAA